MRLDLLAVTLGVALLVATVALASFRARDHGHLDWSTFALGIAATLGLLGVAAGAQLLTRNRRRAAELVSWPGAFGAVSAGLMLLIGVDKDWSVYPAGLLVLALSVLGYLLVPRPAFVVSAVVGLLIAYAKLADDVVDFGGVDGSGGHYGLAVGGALFVFAVLVTAAGWALPTRVYSGAVAGAVVVIGYASALVELLLIGLVIPFDGGPDNAPHRGSIDAGVWWIFAFSVLLIALWLFCAWVTDHVAFRLLVVALAASVVPLGTSALAVDHPTWWELALGLFGGAVLGGAGVRAVSARAREGATVT